MNLKDFHWGEYARHYVVTKKKIKSICFADVLKIEYVIYNSKHLHKKSPGTLLGFSKIACRLLNNGSST